MAATWNKMTNESPITFFVFFFPLIVLVIFIVCTRTYLSYKHCSTNTAEDYSVRQAQQQDEGSITINRTIALGGDVDVFEYDDDDDDYDASSIGAASDLNELENLEEEQNEIAMLYLIRVYFYDPLLF